MVFLKRLFLLNKRLYKQITYVILLAAIPLCVFVLKVSSKDGGNIVTVAVYAEDYNDETADTLIKEIGKIRDEFKFVTYESESEAVSAVEDGTASEAWIIPKDLGRHFKSVAAGKNAGSPITIYVREESVSHLMMREILENISFKLFSSEIYRVYLENELQVEVTDDSYKEAFDTKVLPDNLFKLEYLNGIEENESGFLLSPVRGLLAILLVISALAASIYYIKDEGNGLFIYWHTRFKNLRTLGYYSVVLFNSSVLVLLSMYLAGIAGNPGREILLLLVYDLSVILFSIILKNVLQSIKAIGVAMPLLVVLGLVLSPIFVDLKSMRVLEIFVPSFHYLLSVYDNNRLISMLIYCAVEIIVLEILSFSGRIKDIKALSH